MAFGIWHFNQQSYFHNSTHCDIMTGSKKTTNEFWLIIFDSNSSVSETSRNHKAHPILFQKINANKSLVFIAVTNYK